MPMKMKRLRQILSRYGVREDESRGKGSHTFFQRTVDGVELGYPIPTHGNEILDCYVKGVWRALRINETVSYRDFLREE